MIKTAEDDDSSSKDIMTTKRYHIKRKKESPNLEFFKTGQLTGIVQFTGLWEFGVIITRVPEK